MTAITASGPGSTAVRELQLVSFMIGAEEYGVDILQVQEINRMLSISRIPRAPEYVEGIINLRGKVIPIISLRKRFTLADKEQDKKTRIIVVNIAGSTLGLVVDSVSEVLRLRADAIEPPPSMVSGREAEFIYGVGKIGSKLVILLDLQRLFKDVQEQIANLVAPTAGNQQ